MSSFESIIYEKKGNIAYVTLNRPQALNAYNIQMRDELYQILGAIKNDQEVLVSIFKGAGEKAFCAGADLSEFLTAPTPMIARQVRWERDVWGLELPNRRSTSIENLGKRGFELGRKLARTQDRPSALIARNEILAVWVMSGFMAGGGKVPQDLSIVTLNNTQFAGMSPVPLTAVGPSLNRLARTCATFVREAVSADRNI